MTSDVLTGIGVGVGLLVLLGLVVGGTLLLGLVTGLLWWLEYRRQRLAPGRDAAAPRSLAQRAVHAWAAVVATVLAAVAMPQLTPGIRRAAPAPVPRRPSVWHRVLGRLRGEP